MRSTHTVRHHLVEVGDARIMLEGLDSDPLLDRLIEERGDERLIPYWCEVWPSAVALARELHDRAERIRGRCVFDLGCGLGLAGIAAAMAGARRVLFGDLLEPAVDFAMRNAARNGVARVCEGRRFDWREDAVPPDVELLLGADILYERVEMPYILDLLARRVPPGADILLADPGRCGGPMILEEPRLAGHAFRADERPISWGGRDLRIRMLRGRVPSRRQTPTEAVAVS